MPSYGYSDMIDLVMDGHHSTLTRKSCEILMKRGMYLVKNNKYMFSRDIRLKVYIIQLFINFTVREHIIWANLLLLLISKNLIHTKTIQQIQNNKYCIYILIYYYVVFLYSWIMKFRKMAWF